MRPEISLAMAATGIVSRRQHPELTGSLDRAVRNGQLVPLLPGTYASQRSFETLVAAVVDWDPDAVFVGPTAARLLWWPGLRRETVHAWTSRQPERVVPGTELRRHSVDPDLVVDTGRLLVQHPAASTLDLARLIGPTAIDEALRRGAVSVTSLRWAFKQMPGRPGNVKLAGYLRDSRDSPWSPLEREAHLLLRGARIRGWKANFRIRLASGVVFVDIAFPAYRLIVELDGWQFHHDRASFTDDRRRDAALKVAGWTVLRFTADSLSEMVDHVAGFIRRAERRPRR